MALNFKKYERQDRTELGSIATLAGKGGSFRLASVANFMNEAKRVALVITKANGTSDIVICSTTVSTKLRNKDLKLSQLLNFVVVEQLTNSGEVMNVVVMPSAGTELPSVAVGTQVEEYQPVQEFDLEGMIAF